MPGIAFPFSFPFAFFTAVPVELAASGTAATGGTGSANLTVVTPVPPLTLADFDSAGLDVDCLALITAAAPPVVYADTNRGGTQTPDDGELGLGAGETLITRIRILDSGGRIQINGNGVPTALVFSDYFGASNTTSDRTLWIQTAPRAASSVLLDGTGANGANYQFNNVDDEAAINAIGAGDLFIIAVTTPASTAVELAATGVAATGGTGSAGLTVGGGGGVSLAASGAAATGGAGSASLRVGGGGGVSLAASGEAAAAQAGSASLVVGGGSVSLAATGTAATGGTGSADLTVVTPVPPLTLADFDSAGLDVDALALITAAAPETIYADSNRGGTQTPEDGEMGLGAGETLITRIRITDAGASVTLNDNDTPVALVLSDFFGAGGTTSAWTLTLQTAARVMTSDAISVSGSNFGRFAFTDAADIAAINGIGAGDLFIIAVAQAVASSVSLAASGTPATGGTGSAGLTVGGGGGVSLAASGAAATGGAGSASLRVGGGGGVGLAASGEAAAAQAGSASLVVGGGSVSLAFPFSFPFAFFTAVPVELAASGTAATGGTGSANLTVVTPPVPAPDPRRLRQRRPRRGRAGADHGRRAGDHLRRQQPRRLADARRRRAGPGRGRDADHAHRHPGQRRPAPAQRQRHAGGAQSGDLLRGIADDLGLDAHDPDGRSRRDIRPDIDNRKQLRQVHHRRRRRHRGAQRHRGRRPVHPRRRAAANGRHAGSPRSGGQRRIGIGGPQRF